MRWRKEGPFFMHYNYYLLESKTVTDLTLERPEANNHFETSQLEKVIINFMKIIFFRVFTYSIVHIT